MIDINDYAQKIDYIERLARQAGKLKAALLKARSIVEEHAEDERIFWGDEDKHGLAAQAEATLAEINEALRE